MLQNVPFYWGSVRKMVECFGVVFSDLHIVRLRGDGSTYQTLKIPCEYGPKEKWLVRNVQNPMPGTDDQVEMVLPRMSYEMKGWQYDNPRKLTSTGRTVQAITNNTQVLKAQFNPVPYNFRFELSIMAKNVEDGLMIVEQILPFFTPDYTISVNDMPDLALEKDIVILHDGAVQQDDTYEGTFQDRRTIIWTLNFTMKGYLYPPVNLKKINLQSQIRFFVDGPIAAVPVSVISAPYGSTAVTIVDADVVNVSSRVIVIATPSTVTLSGGESQIFVVTLVNATDIGFTALVPVTATTADDTYSLDLVHGTFTYTAGIGIRHSQETLTVMFVSVRDPTQNVSVTLVLNP